MIFILIFGYFIAAVAAFKDSLNVTCKIQGGQVLVDIFPKKPIYEVQLKNADQACDPQEFTTDSIRFIIPHFQLGICGFARADSSNDGLDGTYWNNIIWKDKPISPKTKTTKIKCVQKLSTMLNSQSSQSMGMPFPVQVQVIHLPFGAFPSAFNTDAAETSPPGASGGLQSQVSSRFPPALPPGMSMGPTMIWLRSGGAFGQPVIQKK